ncbi:flagellar hook-basal body complex protein FliE [Candidatus Nitrospira inopinata]|jgi:flagellar hook-basal body complex protein FliE|uniref:Flagellar hook-basal body complex protein FliE n=1 Tax=Candidatus Nitrospira inopinata TaxID=1715989 RepID=A0A0S4KVD2_9BACT|nr:flagellar hook-basal body complex protein FliE [Candidatus Nitrospira inopinata]CUQ67098.1 putative Flagellar hook-basal body complex protein FliE [Candidatus Nitrospira inopinata]
MKEVSGIGQSIASSVGASSVGQTTGAAESPGFMDSLKQAIGQVNDAQLQAGRAVDALMTGESQDIHRAMVALQQADVSFQLMMQIRNKLIAAYEEIQRMQV